MRGGKYKLEKIKRKEKCSGCRRTEIGKDDEEKIERNGKENVPNHCTRK